MSTATKAPTATCGRCSATITATAADRYAATATTAADEAADRAVATAARRAGWERDHEVDRWLCSSCAEAVAAERVVPCPGWCTHCGGYEFISPGTLHRRRWYDDGQLVAEIAQMVESDHSVVWTAAMLPGVPDDFDSLADLTEHIRVATELLDAIREHGLTLGEVG